MMSVISGHGNNKLAGNSILIFRLCLFSDGIKCSVSLQSSLRSSNKKITSLLVRLHDFLLCTRCEGSANLLVRCAHSFVSVQQLENEND